MRVEWFQKNKVSPDVVGVNYYPAFSTLRVENGVTEPQEAGTTGLRDLIELYWQRYKKPMVLTETSLTGPAEEKTAWLQESVATLHELRGEGVPIQGITWFPFMTLVDWLYRYENDLPDDWFRHMGLVDLVRQPNLDLERQPNAAFETFKTMSRK